MKVIKDNYKKFPIEVTCEHCGSIIEIEKRKEIYLDGLTGEHYWECPLCSGDNEINIEF